METKPTDPAPGASEKNEGDLFRIMTFSTSLGFGVLAAFLASLDDFSKTVAFRFSIWTVVAFVAGAASGWILWTVVRRIGRKRNVR